MQHGTVVVVDDEPHIAELVELYCSRDGFDVVCVRTGHEAIDVVARDHPRLVVLDVGLPDIDGLEVCRRLRASSSVPIVFLTARDSEVDRVLGLELGADDYVAKPFSPAELMARIRAVLRRTDGSDGAAGVDVLAIGTLDIDTARREIRVGSEVVECTTKEFDLLQFLARRIGRAMSRQQILDGVWGVGWYGDERTVDVHIGQLRKKIGDAVAITTVRGIGYRLDRK